MDLVADKLARQVKRHRDKRRGRREGVQERAAPPPGVGREAPQSSA